MSDIIRQCEPPRTVDTVRNEPNISVVRSDNGVTVIRNPAVLVDLGGCPPRAPDPQPCTPGVVEVITKGPKGDKGDPGATIAPVAFSYGDATADIWTADAAGVLTTARIVVTAPFDGAGAELMLGTSAAPAAALPPDYVAPSAAGEYEATADLRLAEGQAVRLSITPGSGASQGAGTVFLTFLPD